MFIIMTLNYQIDRWEQELAYITENSMQDSHISLFRNGKSF